MTFIKVSEYEYINPAHIVSVSTDGTGNRYVVKMVDGQFYTVPLSSRAYAAVAVLLGDRNES